MDSGTKLQVDLQSAEFQHGVQQQFWELIEIQGCFVFIKIFALDETSYILELDCSGYGNEPLRGRFVDPISKACVASAWPNGNNQFTGWVKFHPGELFICWDQDREGIARHSDWKTRKAWTKNPNQVWAYLDFIRKLLHYPAYGYHQQK